MPTKSCMLSHHLCAALIPCRPHPLGHSVQLLLSTKHTLYVNQLLPLLTMIFPWIPLGLVLLFASCLCSNVTLLLRTGLAILKKTLYVHTCIPGTPYPFSLLNFFHTTCQHLIGHVHLIIFSVPHSPNLSSTSK